LAPTGAQEMQMLVRSSCGSSLNFLRGKKGGNGHALIC